MNIGVIGLGGRLSSVIPTMAKYTEGLKVVAVTDIDEAGARSRMVGYEECYAEDIRFYTEADDMLDNEKLDGVLIGTHCDLHTEMAVKVIKHGIPLFLEKPVCTTMEQVKILNEARLKYNPKVVVSFPLRHILLYQKVKELVASGIIGKVCDVEAFNNVDNGRVYYKSWYRNEAETGGMWLQKATHDFDAINWILGEKPVKICAMKAKQIFTGDMPAGLKCQNCEKYKTCPESTYVIKNIYNMEPFGDMCSFAVDTGNEDSGSAIIRYESGMHVTYTQNFYSRRGAARRGARLYGYKGTLEFDMGPNEIKVYMHNSPEVERYTFSNSHENHHGGDDRIVREFAEMVDGKETESTLKDGILSAYMCLLARESCEKDEFINIADLDKDTIES